ncbi:MAG: CehA/McbA family metallohydrolase [Pseudomonadota bacterium]
MLDAFSSPGHFWRGNLHGHSTVSDGALSPEEVCQRYKAEGYDFICLSDHFMDRFDFAIADTTAYRSNAFTTLIGAEVHAPENSHGQDWHILAVGLPLEFPATKEGETGPALARRAAEAGAFVAVAHPTLSGLSLDDIRSIDAAHAIEVHNTTGAVRVARGDGSVAWDAALEAGIRLNGIAVDDSHFRPNAMDAFGGWVMVKAEENTPEALLAALKAGHFYASQGPVIERVERDGATLQVRCSAVKQINLIGAVFAATHVEGTSLTRAELPLERLKGGWCRLILQDAAGLRAWSNPLWLDG